MEQTLQKYIGAVQIRIREQLQGLGDFPKIEPFDHGCQVGVYRGLQQAIDILEAVMTDEVDLEARR